MTLNPEFHCALPLLVLVTAFSVSRTAFGLTSDEFCDDVSHLTNYVLSVEEDVGDFAKCFQSDRKRTNDEMAEELIFIYLALDGNPDMAGERQFAIELLGDFPTTNSIPFLIQVFQEEEDLFGGAALASYLRVHDYSRESLAFIGDFFDTHPRTRHRRTAFSYISHELNYGRPSMEKRERMLDFILQRACKENYYADWLDRILCKHLPGYEKSDRRRETVESVMANPSANSNAIQWAESTLAAMRQSQEKAVSLETADADTDVIVPANENEEAAATDISENEETSAPEPPIPHRTRWVVMVALLMALIAIVGAGKRGC